MSKEDKPITVGEIVPYIVYGTGCCGTTFLSKILSERFGVCMGFSYGNRTPYMLNQGVSMECLVLKEIIRGFVDNEYGITAYINKFIEYAQKRYNQKDAWGNRYKKWGFKDPMGNVVKYLIWHMPAFPKLIICFRDSDKVFNSILKMKLNQGFDERAARAIAATRIREDQIVKKTFPEEWYLRIDIRGDNRDDPNKTTREEVIEKLEGRWPELND